MESLLGDDRYARATLARARAGDEAAFRRLTDPHQRELQLHCYRILGSPQDSEDLVQETPLAAWRGLERFEERASVRAWLYRIATNRCLNALRARSRRPREVQAMPTPPEPTRRTDPIRLEPYPDALLDDIPDRSPGPAARYEAREAVERAFIGAVQNVPPRQRAVLVLRDVLGFRSAEIADLLDTGEGSVKGALQRARATLAGRLPGSDRERAPLPDSSTWRAGLSVCVRAIRRIAPPCGGATRLWSIRPGWSRAEGPHGALARRSRAPRCPGCPGSHRTSRPLGTQRDPGPSAPRSRRVGTRSPHASGPAT
jgi:RNA polymerase sigma-70 factor, ECF subfamily